MIFFKNKILLFFLGCFFLVSNTKVISQVPVFIQSSNFCSFSFSDSNNCGDVLLFETFPLPEDSYYHKMIHSILTSIGIKNTVFLAITKKKGVEGFFIKETKDNRPCIIINQNFLKDTTVALTIIMHELGHYLNDNERLCSNPNIELDADQFAGVCLAKLAFSRTESLRTYDIISEGNGVSHPKRAMRIQRFSKGWDDGLKVFDFKSFTSINPIITWQKNSNKMVVDIDEKNYFISFAVNKVIKIYNLNDVTDSIVYDDEIGLLYISRSNSTYQLHSQHNTDHRGIGRLVNDRTSLVYVRLENSFRYYDGGNEVKIDQSGNKGFINKGRDYFIEYKPKYSDKKIKVLFKNYGFSKKTGFYLQPAINQ